jgi:hypothetical protein
MMDDSPMEAFGPMLRRGAIAAVACVVGVAGFGYAVHEHNGAQHLAAQNQQANAELMATRSQLNDLTAKVNALETKNEAAVPPASVPAPAPVAVVHRAGKPHAGRLADGRLTKMQKQLDAEGQAIADTRGDLENTRTELTGSIARTHGELVVLEKRGERSYFEFDITKSKQFKHEGPVGISLRKANLKHQYADLQLMVDDRDMVQKHVNLYQPVMFYQADTEQPIQVVINDITKDHIHGYVSAPSYRKSELAAMSDAATNPDQAANAEPQPAPRKKLTVSQTDGPQ